MIILVITEIKLRRQAASLDYSRSLDDGYISHKDHLTHSTSTISSQSVVIDHVDPPLTTSNSPMDCVDSVLTDQQLTSDHGSYTTSRKPACQVRILCDWFCEIPPCFFIQIA